MIGPYNGVEIAAAANPINIMVRSGTHCVKGLSKKA